MVTHTKPTASYPSAYTFVTDGVASAIEQAKNAAGDKVVGLHGATVMQQALTLERTRALVTLAATHIGFRVVR
jgi:dihydrofolate reductase